MAELRDGLVGSPQEIFSASPVEDDFDSKGKKKDFEWEKDFSNLEEGTIIATAKYGKRTYQVSVDRVRVSIVTEPFKEPSEKKAEAKAEAKEQAAFDKEAEKLAEKESKVKEEPKQSTRWDFSYHTNKSKK